MIGVLGGHGSVGAHAARLLARQGAGPLRIGGRDLDRVRRFTDASLPGADAQPVRADIEDPVSLAAFVDGCELVVHCAGPSRRTSGTTALAALRAGASVVDAGGGERAAGTVGDVGERTVLWDAGALPGLSGLLPRALAAAHFDTVHRLTAYAGVLDRFTATGADDYLDGVLGPLSEPLAAWRGGARRSGAARSRTGQDLPAFPRPVALHPYLDGEAERLARDLSLTEGTWYTAFDGDHLAAALAAARTRDRAEAVRAVCAAAALDTAGRAPHATLLVQLDGAARGTPRTRTAVLRAPGVSALTGAVAAVAALAVLRGETPPGAHPAAAALDPAAVLARLTADPAVCRLDVHEAAADEPAAVEEGAL
ncbi:saccharopine dehydrogenase NADP-binding domain-containing protein [Streptomyces sp. NPDC047002]|uniref:saccharopine dehydrogenase NADP-binding domain-containing protein n=1 Tax=Streptomyces sp. NPDC047002 TaxID=3155475 RepID=UPI003456C4E6